MADERNARDGDANETGVVMLVTTALMSGKAAGAAQASGAILAAGAKRQTGAFAINDESLAQLNSINVD